MLDGRKVHDILEKQQQLASVRPCVIPGNLGFSSHSVCLHVILLLHFRERFAYQCKNCSWLLGHWHGNLWIPCSIPETTISYSERQLAEEAQQRDTSIT